MRRAICALTCLVCVAVFASSNRAESTCEFSVQLSANVQAAPAQITLNWLQDSCELPASYTIYRKAPQANHWGPGTVLPGNTTSFADTNVTLGMRYEYKVVKSAPRYTGYGYLFSGIEAPLTEDRGRLLLVVDNTYSAELATELMRLEQDLVGDGWGVTRIDVGRTDTVDQVKGLIKKEYKGDPENVRAVFLFGHVPVPYSGNIVPDGHMPDHQGAWPCDGFYGDMDGTWTDTSVNITTAADARTRNVPGDGKFDQSTFPAPIKLMVGRVDLANMPGRLFQDGPATFPSEQELLRNYLNKDHKFRHKEFDVPRRGMVGDYFGVRNGEAFAASGWRNLGAFVGAGNITTLPKEGTWISTLSTNPCLVAYGCGSGSYTSIGGLGNTDAYHDGITTEVMSHDVKVVFALLFGSWLGDWDSEDNVQRAILALPSYGLTCSWSGRPHWFLQHMGLGEPIGFGARLTQNNGPGGLYQNQVNSCAGQTHIALMGDPTLRLHVVAPPTNLAISNANGGVNLNWTAANDSVSGYHVYRAMNPGGPFTRLSPSLIQETHFDDTNYAGAIYMVRAVKLEVSASGSYYNPSQGVFEVWTGNALGDLAQEPSLQATNHTQHAPKSVDVVASQNTAIRFESIRALPGDFGTNSPLGTNIVSLNTNTISSVP